MVRRREWRRRHNGTDTTTSAAERAAPDHNRSAQGLLAVRMHRRTRVMILLAALAGLRTHEIAKVRGQDVDIDARRLHVVGKGGHAATIPLHPLLVEASLTMPRHGWWFPANSRRPGQHMRSRCAVDVIANAMRRAGIPDGTLTGCATGGTNLINSGTDLRTTQPLMQHAQTSRQQRSTHRWSTTAAPRRSTGSTRSSDVRYTAVDDSEIRAAMLAAIGDYVR